MRRHPVFAPYLLVALVAACAVPPRPAVDTNAVTVGVVTLGASKIPACGRLGVTVADADPNVDPLSRDAVHVYVTSETSSQFERVPLVETGANTGVFAGEIPIALGPEVAGDGTIEVAHGNTVMVTYRDQNAGGCAPDTFSASAVVDAYGPDLSVTVGSYGPSVIAGNDYVVSGTLRNDCGGAAAPSTVYAAIVGTYEDNDGYEHQIVSEIGTFRTADLAPGDAVSFDFPHSVPDNLNGPFTLMVWADLLKEVAERDETNNTVSRAVGVVGADLTVPPASVQVSVVAGHVQVRGRVQNAAGGAAAPASTVGGELSRTIRDDEGYEVGQVFLFGPAPIDALLAGGLSPEFALSWPIPEGIAGAFTLRVFADSGFAAMESSEANNFTTYPQLVVLP